MRKISEIVFYKNNGVKFFVNSKPNRIYTIRKVRGNTQFDIRLDYYDSKSSGFDNIICSKIHVCKNFKTGFWVKCN